MKSLLWITGIALLSMVFTLSSCALEEMAPPEKPPPIVEAKKVPPPEKVPEVKVKPLKAAGDLGLIDLEKNYMVLVTKEGKLVTVDFNDKTKITKYVPQKAKMSDVDLGTSGTITYKPKIIEIESLEFKAKAKKGE